MARLEDQPDPSVLERVFSPDRRLALDYLPYPDPRTRSELEVPEAVALRDAESGRLLAEFSNWTFIGRYRWTEAGGVALELVCGACLVVAPDLATFRPGDPSAPSRPIAELPAWLRAIAPPPPPPIPPPSRLGRAATIAVIAGLLALIGYGISRLPVVSQSIASLRGDAPPRPGNGGIDAWILRCPGIGRVNMSLADDGRLRVPPVIAPAPLPPVDGTGRRFGEGRVVVEVDGVDATWWPRGPAGEAVACRSVSHEVR